MSELRSPSLRLGFSTDDGYGNVTRFVFGDFISSDVIEVEQTDYREDIAHRLGVDERTVQVSDETGPVQAPGEFMSGVSQEPYPCTAMFKRALAAGYLIVESLPPTA